MATGPATPSPPELFTPVYDYLEYKWGFSSTWIRTDFRFASSDEAYDAIKRSPFGDALLDKMIESDEGIFLPECTGIWWRNV